MIRITTPRYANIKARHTVVLVADLQQVQMKWGSAFLSAQVICTVFANAA
jgi:hypothetical protein